MGMSDKVSEAINELVQIYKKEYGKDAQMEEGEEIVGVYNDAVIILSLKEDKTMKIEVKVGAPYRIDRNMF